MISRRIIRTKVLQILYAHHSTPDKSIDASEKELHFSIQKTYDLYHLLLALPVEIAEYAEKLIDLRKQKNFPTEEELNPNMKFVSNRIISRLRKNEELNRYLNQHKLNWSNNQELIRKIFQSLEESDLYKSYMHAEEDNFQLDKKFCEDFFTTIVLGSEYIFSEFEEQSI
ncbi:MAG: hypothetical protein LWW85_14830 [Marinilabiliales bacterium]|nr:hypothetical protein [Marinilabiliales bacterium]